MKHYTWENNKALLQVARCEYLSHGIGSRTSGSSISPISQPSPSIDTIDSAKLRAWSFSAGAVHRIAKQEIQ